MGRNWYSKKRNTINGRWKTHTRITHAAAEITKKEIQEQQIKLNQLYADRINKKESEERKKRREEKEEEERKKQEEEEFRRKEERRIRVTREECDKQDRWRREWEASEEQRRRDFNPEYEERRWMQRYAHWDY